MKLPLVCALAFMAISDAVTAKYRSHKINYIYDKALQHIQDKKRIARLENELQSFDGIYMDAKKKDGEGRDMLKEYARIDEKLRAVLEKLDDPKFLLAFAQELKKRKLRNEQEMTEANLAQGSEKFKDQQLQKLWETAKSGKFGQEELDVLHQDLKKAERKIKEYHDALNSFNKIADENSVHFDEHDTIEERNRRLKEVHREMNQHIDDVHQKVHSEQYSPFEDAKAQANANLTTYDLDILRDELKHFEHQLKKLDFHQEELNKVKEDAELHGKNTVKHLEHSELEAKHERLTRKLKKLENYLVTKVRHSEL